MASVSILPKLFRWLFTAVEVLCVVAAIVIALTYLIDPRLPPGTHFGPFAVDFAGQPGTVALSAVNNDSDFTVTALRGNIVLFVEQAGGLIEVAKRYGLPAILISAIFFVVLFDLLRRLFRNVSRGDSFTRQSVYFVQLVGASLIVYSFVSAYAEGWFAVAMYTYLSQHAVLTVSGASLHLPAPDVTGGGFRFGGSAFFTGLLVLAISEVFRQGLTLKSEHDLTV
jgi:hypothetical protein